MHATYTYACTQTHTHTHTRMHVHMYTHIRTQAPTHTHTNLHLQLSCIKSKQNIQHVEAVVHQLLPGGCPNEGTQRLKGIHVANDVVVTLQDIDALDEEEVDVTLQVKGAKQRGGEVCVRVLL